jgi:thiosulfate/3-mercaptopyruvate sulfurtransferase
MTTQKIKNDGDYPTIADLKQNAHKKEDIVPTTTSTLNLLCDVDTLRTLIKEDKVRIIDVRKKEDYLKDHIPTSVSLPLSDLLADDSPESIVKISNNLGISDNTPVVVYDDTFGALASRVAWS